MSMTETVRETFDMLQIPRMVEEKLAQPDTEKWRFALEIDLGVK